MQTWPTGVRDGPGAAGIVGRALAGGKEEQPQAPGSVQYGSLVGADSSLAECCGSRRHGIDPAARMRDIENVEVVFSNGVMFDSQALLAEVKAKFGWQ
jgi:hypothetical protein